MVQPSRREIIRAARILRDGGLVAFPTETVYGLGADASHERAVRRLFTVKRRPLDHPVIVHIGRPGDLDLWAAEVPEAARSLGESFWPGPLTLVLRRRPGRVPDAVTGGRETVGLRVPAHPVASALLAEHGGGLAAPSANRFGRVSPTCAADVAADLGDDVDLILDGGPCGVGVESTIVDCSGAAPLMLRLGGVTEDDLAAVLGEVPERLTQGQIAAPGTRRSHYSPQARVVVCAEDEVLDLAAALVAGGEAVGLLAPAPPAALPATVVLLGPPADARDYAHVLYARLREADLEGLDVLLAVPPPEEGIGAAVADRLRRAAAR